MLQIQNHKNVFVFLQCWINPRFYINNIKQTYNQQNVTFRLYNKAYEMTQLTHQPLFLFFESWKYIHNLPYICRNLYIESPAHIYIILSLTSKPPNPTSFTFKQNNEYLANLMMRMNKAQFAFVLMYVQYIYRDFQVGQKSETQFFNRRYLVVFF